MGPVLLYCHRKLNLALIQKAKTHILDLGPRKLVLAIMRKFVPHITRHFISSVPVIDVQRKYLKVLDLGKSRNNISLVVSLPVKLTISGTLRLQKMLPPFDV